MGDERQCCNMDTAKVCDQSHCPEEADLRQLLISSHVLDNTCRVKKLFRERESKRDLAALTFVMADVAL